MDAKQDINRGPVCTLVTDSSHNSVSYIMHGLCSFCISYREVYRVITLPVKVTSYLHLLDTMSD